MSSIRRRIGQVRDGYPDLVVFHNDWQLMFNNARLFNEDGSQILADAGVLEGIVDNYLTDCALKNPSLPGAQQLIEGEL